MQTNIHEIYNLLFAGETLRIQFLTHKETEQFRITLLRYKKKQDTMLLGANLVEKTQACSFQLQALLPLVSGDPVLEATIKFKDKDIGKKYTVQIVQEIQQEEDDTSSNR